MNAVRRVAGHGIVPWGPVPRGVFRGGAFASRTAAESHFVRCGLDTTTQRDIENGVVNVEVGFAPLRPAEFVVFRIRHHFD